MFTQLYHAMPINIQEDNGESNEYHYLADERGNVYSKEEVLLLFEKVKEFYNREDSYERVSYLIKRKEVAESLTRITSPWKILLNENGKYLIPAAEYKYKEFDKDKRDWSCKCGWCGNKVSSKTDKAWYSVHSFYLGIISERACSEDCAQLIWKEGVKNWIHENGYQKFFDC